MSELAEIQPQQLTAVERSRNALRFEERSLLNLLAANETAIKQMARALKGEMRVPGVVARNEQVVATKRKAA